MSAKGEFCPVCGGDCAAANPPVIFCPMRDREMNDNQYMKRTMYCDECPWVGISGELIARDKLRCPKCDSDRFNMGL